MYCNAISFCLNARLVGCDTDRSGECWALERAQSDVFVPPFSQEGHRLPRHIYYLRVSSDVSRIVELQKMRIAICLPALEGFRNMITGKDANARLGLCYLWRSVRCSLYIRSALPTRIPRGASADDLSLAATR